MHRHAELFRHHAAPRELEREREQELAATYVTDAPAFVVGAVTGPSSSCEAVLPPSILASVPVNVSACTLFAAMTPGGFSTLATVNSTSMPAKVADPSTLSGIVKAMVGVPASHPACVVAVTSEVE